MSRGFFFIIILLITIVVAAKTTTAATFTCGAGDKLLIENRNFNEPINIVADPQDNVAAGELFGCNVTISNVEADCIHFLLPIYYSDITIRGARLLGLKNGRSLEQAQAPALILFQNESKLSLLSISDVFIQGLDNTMTSVANVHAVSVTGVKFASRVTTVQASVFSGIRMRHGTDSTLMLRYTAMVWFAGPSLLAYSPMLFESLSLISSFRYHHSSPSLSNSLSTTEETVWLRGVVFAPEAALSAADAAVPHQVQGSLTVRSVHIELHDTTTTAATPLHQRIVDFDCVSGTNVSGSVTVAQSSITLKHIVAAGVSPALIRVGHGLSVGGVLALRSSSISLEIVTATQRVSSPVDVAGMRVAVSGSQKLVTHGAWAFSRNVISLLHVSTMGSLFVALFTAHFTVVGGAPGQIRFGGSSRRALNFSSNAVGVISSSSSIGDVGQNVEFVVALLRCRNADIQHEAPTATPLTDIILSDSSIHLSGSGMNMGNTGATTFVVAHLYLERTDFFGAASLRISDSSTHVSGTFSYSGSAKPGFFGGFVVTAYVKGKSLTVGEDITLHNVSSHLVDVYFLGLPERRGATVLRNVLVCSDSASLGFRDFVASHSSVIVRRVQSLGNAWGISTIYVNLLWSNCGFSGESRADSVRLLNSSLLASDAVVSNQVSVMAVRVYATFILCPSGYVTPPQTAAYSAHNISLGLVDTQLTATGRSLVRLMLLYLYGPVSAVGSITVSDISSLVHNISTVKGELGDISQVCVNLRRTSPNTFVIGSLNIRNVVQRVTGGTTGATIAAVVVLIARRVDVTFGSMFVAQQQQQEDPIYVFSVRSCSLFVGGETIASGSVDVLVLSMESGSVIAINASEMDRSSSRVEMSGNTVSVRSVETTTLSARIIQTTISSYPAFRYFNRVMLHDNSVGAESITAPLSATSSSSVVGVAHIRSMELAGAAAEVSILRCSVHVRSVAGRGTGGGILDTNLFVTSHTSMKRIVVRDTTLTVTDCAASVVGAAVLIIADIAVLILPSATSSSSSSSLSEGGGQAAVNITRCSVSVSRVALLSPQIGILSTVGFRWTPGAPPVRVFLGDGNSVSVVDSSLDWHSSAPGRPTVCALHLVVDTSVNAVFDQPLRTTMDIAVEATNVTVSGLRLRKPQAAAMVLLILSVVRVAHLGTTLGRYYNSSVSLSASSFLLRNMTPLDNVYVESGAVYITSSFVAAVAVRVLEVEARDISCPHFIVGGVSLRDVSIAPGGDGGGLILEDSIFILSGINAPMTQLIAAFVLVQHQGAYVADLSLAGAAISRSSISFRDSVVAGTQSISVILFAQTLDFVGDVAMVDCSVEVEGIVPRGSDASASLSVQIVGSDKDVFFMGQTGQIAVRDSQVRFSTAVPGHLRAQHRAGDLLLAIAMQLVSLSVFAQSEQLSVLIDNSHLLGVVASSPRAALATYSTWRLVVFSRGGFYRVSVSSCSITVPLAVFPARLVCRAPAIRMAQYPSFSPSTAPNITVRNVTVDISATAEQQQQHHDDGTIFCQDELYASILDSSLSISSAGPYWTSAPDAAVDVTVDDCQILRGNSKNNNLIAAAVRVLPMERPLFIRGIFRNVTAPTLVSFPPDDPLRTASPRDDTFFAGSLTFERCRVDDGAAVMALGDKANSIFRHGVATLIFRNNSRSGRGKPAFLGSTADAVDFNGTEIVFDCNQWGTSVERGFIIGRRARNLLVRINRSSRCGPLATATQTRSKSPTTGAETESRVDPSLSRSSNNSISYSRAAATLSISLVPTPTSSGDNSSVSAERTLSSSFPVPPSPYVVPASLAGTSSALLLGAILVGGASAAPSAFRAGQKLVALQAFRSCPLASVEELAPLSFNNNPTTMELRRSGVQGRHETTEYALSTMRGTIVGNLLLLLAVVLLVLVKLLKTYMHPSSSPMRNKHGHRRIHSKRNDYEEDVEMSEQQKKKNKKSNNNSKKKKEEEHQSAASAAPAAAAAASTISPTTTTTKNKKKTTNKKKKKKEPSPWVEASKKCFWPGNAINVYIILSPLAAFAVGTLFQFQQELTWAIVGAVLWLGGPAAVLFWMVAVKVAPREKLVEITNKRKQQQQQTLTLSNFFSYFNDNDGEEEWNEASSTLPLFQDVFDVYRDLPWLLCDVLLDLAAVAVSGAAAACPSHVCCNVASIIVATLAAMHLLLLFVFFGLRVFLCRRDRYVCAALSLVVCLASVLSVASTFVASSATRDGISDANVVLAFIGMILGLVLLMLAGEPVCRRAAVQAKKWWRKRGSSSKNSSSDEDDGGRRRRGSKHSGRRYEQEEAGLVFMTPDELLGPEEEEHHRHQHSSSTAAAVTPSAADDEAAMSLLDPRASRHQQQQQQDSFSPRNDDEQDEEEQDHYDDEEFEEWQEEDEEFAHNTDADDDHPEQQHGQFRGRSAPLVVAQHDDDEDGDEQVAALAFEDDGEEIPMEELTGEELSRFLGFRAAKDAAIAD